jgi:hypothetical protein
MNIAYDGRGITAQVEVDRHIRDLIEQPACEESWPLKAEAYPFVWT